MRYRRCGRSGLSCRRSRSGCGRTSATTGRSRRSARSCAARSTSASPTSTWPTTTGRRTARPRRTSAGSWPQDLRPYRDELIISTKAGYDMWPGPYGEWGSRKYLLASLDQSLARHGPRLRRHLLLPPLRPRHAARGDDGRARHGGARRARRSTSASRPTRPSAPRRRRAILRDLGTPLLIHQPSYSMLNRWIEDGPARRARRARASAASSSRRWRRACSPTGTSTASPRTRAPRRTSSLSPDLLTDENLDARARAERDRRAARPDAWRRWRSPGCCATPRVTSALIGASSVEQLEENVAALRQPRLHRRGAGRDRPPRRRGRHQPLGGVQRRLSATVSRPGRPM